MYNVYLKDEKVTANKGFMKTTHHDGSLSHHMRLHHGDGGSDGRWRFVLGPDAKEVPPELAELVEEVSFMTDIPTVPHREWGVYRHESARAEVTASPDRKGSKVHITGKNLADVRELHHRILAGSIRPNESYEGAQDGMPRWELEMALRTARAKSEKFRELVEKLRRKDKRGWPFCTAGGMADEIEKILNSPA